MASVSYALLLLILVISETNFGQPTSDVVLSRRKRYLIFPEGSSLSVALCMTAQTTLPTEIWTEAINWGISYELPNNVSQIRAFTHPKQAMQRRHRRDLYQKMETIMNSMGFDGRACIFRALCEASRTLTSSGNSIAAGLLRIIFKYPLQRLMHFEPEEHRLYHRAYRKGLDSYSECLDMFPGCSFSLIEMALGAYSNYEDEVPDYTDLESDLKQE